MTELRWPNEYDQNLANMTKNLQQRTLTFEDDQKLHKYFDIDEP